jgi:hypothetical protein
MKKKLLKTESKNKKCECELTIYIYYSTHFTLELVAIHTATKTADTKKTLQDTLHEMKN